MKWLSYLLFLSFIASCTSKTKECYENQTSLKLEVFSRGSYKMSLYDTNYYYLIEARLVNKTDSIVELYIMSCTNYFNFIIDSNVLTIKPNDCFKNSAYLIPLKPKQIFSVLLLLYSNRELQDQNFMIKLGFVLINPTINSNKSLYEFINENKFHNENIIWSQPFNIYSGAAPFRID